MKTLNSISMEDQVQDMLDLINYMAGSYCVTCHEAQRHYPEISRMLKKLNQYDRHFLLRRIEELR
jgi:hypothetical protein